MTMTPDMKFITQKIEQLNETFSPSRLNEDGRVNSLNDEDAAIDLLMNTYGKENVIKPPPRWWYDILFFGIPLQFKSSSFSNNASDNFSAKKGILYALTDMTIEEVDNAHLSWSKFDKILFENMKDLEGRDYHILVFDKDTEQFHVRSLRTLETLTPNGSNLPFQVNWAKNQKIINREFSEARKFILSAYKSSVIKSTKRHERIMNYEP